MTSVLQEVASLAGWSPSTYYQELTHRNTGVVSAEVQRHLKTATIVVAGCGSIGGAAVEPLTRIGAGHLRLADPGEYEVNNLNRQNATAEDVGRNKAQVAGERARSINPYIDVSVHDEGVHATSIDALLDGAALVIDGIDVTTDSGLRAKVLLHERAAALRLPLFTGWDMAGAQYVRVYDYRRGGAPLDGRLTANDLDTLTSWQVLERLVPARFVPIEMISVVRGALDEPDFSFPQLVHAADLFGALSAHLTCELLAGHAVRTHIAIDLHHAVRPRSAQVTSTIRRVLGAADLLLRIRRSSS